MTADAAKPRLRTGTIPGLGLAVLFVLSLAVGVSPLPLNTMLSDPEALQLLLVSRLPRTLAAVLCGAGLAVAGQIMQTLTRNRFVEPSTAGTAQSAALGILIVTLFLPATGLGVKAFVASGCGARRAPSVFLATAHRLPPAQPLSRAAVRPRLWRRDRGGGHLSPPGRPISCNILDVWTNGDFSGVLRGPLRAALRSPSLMVAARHGSIADRLDDHGARRGRGEQRARHRLCAA
jgi:iron complex transport system permease protein